MRKSDTLRKTAAACAAALVLAVCGGGTCEAKTSVLFPEDTETMHAVPKSDASLSYSYVSDTHDGLTETVKVKVTNKGKKEVSLGISAFNFFETELDGGYVEMRGEGKKNRTLKRGKSAVLTYTLGLTESGASGFRPLAEDSTTKEIYLPFRSGGKYCLAIYDRKGKSMGCKSFDKGDPMREIVVKEYKGKKAL